MTKNVGVVDRAIRLTAALGLFSLFFVLDGAARFAGLVGVIPLATGLLGTCPLYSILGIRTCPLE